MACIFPHLRPGGARRGEARQGEAGWEVREGQGSRPGVPLCSWASGLSWALPSVGLPVRPSCPKGQGTSSRHSERSLAGGVFSRASHTVTDKCWYF